MSITDPGTERPVHVRYFRNAAGGVGIIEESHPGATPLPEGAVEIDRAEYDDGMTAWQLGKEQHVAELRAADAARLTGDYDALVAAGVPDATARRVSGLAALDQLEGK